jgi:hypothetical protein
LALQRLLRQQGARQTGVAATESRAADKRLLAKTSPPPLRRRCLLLGSSLLPGGIVLQLRVEVLRFKINKGARKFA